MFPNTSINIDGTFTGNNMDLNTFFNITHDSTNYAKSLSLIQHDYDTFQESKFLFHLNTIICNQESKTVQICIIAEKILNKFLSQPTTNDLYHYLKNKTERRQQ